NRPNERWIVSRWGRLPPGPAMPCCAAACTSPPGPPAPASLRCTGAPNVSSTSERLPTALRCTGASNVCSTSECLPGDGSGWCSSPPPSLCSLCWSLNIAFLSLATSYARRGAPLPIDPPEATPEQLPGPPVRDLAQGPPARSAGQHVLPVGRTSALPHAGFG